LSHERKSVEALTFALRSLRRPGETHLRRLQQCWAVTGAGAIGEEWRDVPVVIENSSRCVTRRRRVATPEGEPIALVRAAIHQG
jgi:hypothetical protein